jgi:hypothetical protein
MPRLLPPSRKVVCQKYAGLSDMWLPLFVGLAVVVHGSFLSTSWAR